MTVSHEDTQSSSASAVDFSIGVCFVCPTCGSSGKIKKVGFQRRKGDLLTVRCGTCNCRNKIPSGVFFSRYESLSPS